MSDSMKTLAEAFDEDIDNFMENLPKHPYKDGWPEDKWQEEMEKHPFFMTKPLNENEELPPLIEGLQQLKYDESENSPEELANTYKNDGNFSFKCQKYRDAIANYSAGIKFDCSKELKATLYNNRAAANFYLKNYRSALNDSKTAVELKPSYMKAKVRIAQCYYFLEKFEDCIGVCDELLSFDNNNNTILELRKNALSERKIQERNLRKLSKSQQKVISDEKRLLETIIQRNIRYSSSSSVKSAEVKKVISISDLLPTYNDLPLNRVFLDGEELVWPVVFLYPVYNIFDCIQEFKENNTFEDHITSMLSEHPEWDVNKKYKPNAVNIYFKDERNEKFKINMNDTLNTILQHERFAITNGVPLFYILPKGDDVEKEFLTD